jgi:hypothetical protein
MIVSGLGAGVVLTAILVFSAFGIGFASGYGVRDQISRRRWAAAREAYYERHPEKRDQKLAA